MSAASPSPASRFPTLARLFRGYVHQDFDLDGPTPDGAIARFAREATPATVAAARSELQALLASSRTEKALDAALDALGCGFKPSAAGTTARAWLQHVAVLLARL